MGFLSGILEGLHLNEADISSIFGGGPSGWADSFTGWSVLGGETGFEVALTGYFGMAGATLDERLQNFVDVGAGTIIVNAQPGDNGGTNTLLYNAIDQVFVQIYDGIGGWTFDVYPVNPNVPPPPEPGTDNASYEGSHGFWQNYGDHFDLV